MEISAAEFKARCLKLLDEVAATHEPLTITKRVTPIARLLPIEDNSAASGFGYLRGSMRIIGDIIDVPPDTPTAEFSPAHPAGAPPHSA